LQAFKEHNGFTTLNQILDTYTKEILDSQVPQAGPPSADVTQSLKLDVATQGVKHILGLYLKIVNGKNISESSQTATIASRSDRDRRSRDFFSPGQFIVEIRMAVLPIVRKLWESDIVDKGSSQISNRLIDIIRTIALADHEQHACRRTEKVRYCAVLVCML
jgi:E3 ubiquitin-protein ligase HUWE1